MKKLFALLLIIGCIFACASCGDDDATPTALDAFKNAVAASNPTGAVIDIDVDTELGKLHSNYIVTYNQDGTVTIKYTEEEFAPFDPANPAAPAKNTDEGTVVLAADGTYAGSISGTAAGIAAGISLDVAALTDATVTDGGVLTATVAAANTESVLGFNVGADVFVKLSIFDGVVERLDMSYGTTKVSCVYQK